MQYTELTDKNMSEIISLYVGYYNEYEDSEWTSEVAYRRIHQVVTREDSYGLILYEDERPVGFAMGYLEQYEDGLVYDLIEIVITHEYQGKGAGTAFMAELEKRVQEKGAFLIQLQSVNDAMHEHFYGKLGYETCNNLVLKSKMLS